MVNSVLYIFCHNLKQQNNNNNNKTSALEEARKPWVCFCTFSLSLLGCSPVWLLLCTMDHLFTHPSWIDKLSQCILRGKWTDFIQECYLEGCLRFQRVSPCFCSPRVHITSRPLVPTVSPKRPIWSLASAFLLPTQGGPRETHINLESPSLFLYLLFWGRMSPISFVLHSKTCI